MLTNLLNYKTLLLIKTIKMKEFTSTVTLTFDINNHEAIDKNDYINRLMAQYSELFDLEIKEQEISNIEEVN